MTCAAAARVSRACSGPVVVSRLAYDLHEPRRGDIVVFDDRTLLHTEVDSALVAQELARGFETRAALVRSIGRREDS